MSIDFYRGRSLDWFAGASTIVTGMEKFRLKPTAHLVEHTGEAFLDIFDGVFAPWAIDVYDRGAHIASYRWNLIETKSWVHFGYQRRGIATRLIFESAVRFLGYRRCANRSIGGHRSHRAAWRMIEERLAQPIMGST